MRDALRLENLELPRSIATFASADRSGSPGVPCRLRFRLSDLDRFCSRSLKSHWVMARITPVVSVRVRCLEHLAPLVETRR